MISRRGLNSICERCCGSVNTRFETEALKRRLQTRRSRRVLATALAPFSLPFRQREWGVAPWGGNTILVYNYLETHLLGLEGWTGVVELGESGFCLV